MVTKIDRKWRYKWRQKGTKIEALRSKVLFYKILMDFGKIFLFDVFSFGQKAGQNHEQIDFWAAWWAREHEFGSILDTIYNPGRPLYWQILARL